MNDYVPYRPALYAPPMGRVMWAGDNALDAMHGILAGTIMSLLLFWMPLAISLTR
jgi:hypothetical protein